MSMIGTLTGEGWTRLHYITSYHAYAIATSFNLVPRTFSLSMTRDTFENEGYYLVMVACPSAVLEVSWHTGKDK